VIPNSKNFCGGAFSDWLEVNLIEACNGKCSWCIERGGYHPDHHASCTEMFEAIVRTKAKNIILLGGEPTLYKDLFYLVDRLNHARRNVYITTNGSKLSVDFFGRYLGLTGVNISIHHHNLEINREITGVRLHHDIMKSAIEQAHRFGISVRLNCNCISGYIDNCSEVLDYVKFAKELGADRVRFAELKNDEGSFVDLAKIMNYEYGLSDDPFTNGCNQDVVIDGMPVNFRQMCGLQTPKRVKPVDPQQVTKKVLYYDGKIYDGWQVPGMKNDLQSLFQRVAKKEISPEEAMIIYQHNPMSNEDIKKIVDGLSKKVEINDMLGKLAQKSRPEPSSGGGCTY
jgi:organic radical activating enzyme